MKLDTSKTILAVRVVSWVFMLLAMSVAFRAVWFGTELNAMLFLTVTAFIIFSRVFLNGIMIEQIAARLSKLERESQRFPSHADETAELPAGTRGPQPPDTRIRKG